MQGRSNLIHRNRGFTLVESLVVIAVIATLIALLLPAIQQSREAARRTQCKNNLRQLGLAMANYESSHSRYPLPSWISVGFATSNYGSFQTTNVWSIAILPYLDQRNTYASYNFNTSCYDPVNAAASQALIPTYLCPTTPRASNTISYTIPASDVILLGFPPDDLTMSHAGAIDYITTNQVDVSFPYNTTGKMISGFAVGGDMFGPMIQNNNNSPINGRISDVTDGLSTTSMIGELAGRNQLYRNGKQIAANTSGGYAQAYDEAGWNTWVSGGAWADDANGQWAISGRAYDGGNGAVFAGPCAINCSNARVAAADAYYGSAGLYSFHAGGAQILLCDGSVRFLNQTIDGKTIVALVSAQGGEVTNDY